MWNVGCPYPCSRCYQGKCLEECTSTNQSGVTHCFSTLPSCYVSNESYEVNSSCEFGCPRGKYPNTVTKVCGVCHSSCFECTGPLATDCTSCQNGKYLLSQYNANINTYNNYGSCNSKSSSLPFTKKDILVSHRLQDRQLSTLETARQGGTNDPYTDLRSAINWAEELLAPYNDNSVNVTIYLTKGPHFITLNENYYKPRGSSDNQQQNYRLIIR